MANVTGTITLNDFRAGIHGDYHAGVATAANAVDGSIPAAGAATIDGTFRCCADTTGALVPLPRRVQGRVQLFSTPGPHPVMGSAYVLDALAWSSMFSTSPGSGASADGEAVAMAFTEHLDPAGGSSYRQLHRVRLFEPFQSSTSAREIFWGKSNTFSTILPHFQLMQARNWDSSAQATDHHLVWSLRPHLSDGLASGAIPANELPLTSFDTDTTNAGNYLNTVSNMFVWPAVNDTDTSTTGNLFGLIGNTFVTGHQGRVLALNLIGRDFGAGTRRVRTDRLAYNRANTLVSNALLPNWAALIGTYGEENVSGTGFIASTSADQLLIMKHHGGAYLVQGDVENPTVSRLPYLESTYGLSIVPAHTPIGLVYASRNGIFAWAGGDTSTKLSTQIDGHFFRHHSDGEVYGGNSGRMDYWHPWVAVPNNYLLDTRTGGWWRLEATTTDESAPYAHYSVVPSTGRMLAFPYKIGLNVIAWYTYDPALLATSYSWRSQPLVETRDRMRTFQTITLVASPGSSTGTHTVVVTLTGHDETGAPLAPVETTFAFTDGAGDGRPVVLTADVKRNFTAMYVQVQIEASTSNESAACKVHSVNIGHRDAQGVRKS